MVFNGPLEDRILVRELIETYANAVMERDMDAWGAVWAEDAYWALPEYPDLEGFRGRKAIVDGWLAGMNTYASMTDFSKPMIYIATPGAINIDGNTATAHVFTSEIFQDPESGEEIRVRGRYDDELEKRSGQWLFIKRVYRTLHKSQG